MQGFGSPGNQEEFHEDFDSISLDHPRDGEIIGVEPNLLLSDDEEDFGQIAQP